MPVYLPILPVYLSTKPLSIVTLYTNLGFVSALFLLSPCIIILVLFQHSLTIVTLYTNLGDEAIETVLEETEVSTVVCSYDTYGNNNNNNCKKNI